MRPEWALRRIEAITPACVANQKAPNVTFKDKKQGEVFKRGKVWQARYLDHDGKRQSRSGFATKTAAGDFLRDKLRDVQAVRSGEVVAASERPATVEGVRLLLEEARRRGWTTFTVPNVGVLGTLTD